MAFPTRSVILFAGLLFLAPLWGQSNPPPVVIPHIALGGGWKTTVRVVNTSRDAHQIRLNTFQKNGQTLRAMLNGKDSYCHELTVAPLAVADIVINGGDDPVSGYAILHFVSGVALPHTLLYTSTSGMQGAMNKAKGTHYYSDYFQFDNTEGALNGVAILIPDTQTNQYQRLTCYSDTGALLGAYSFAKDGTRMPSPGGFSQLILELPSVLNSTAGMKGLCHFTYGQAAGGPDYKVSRPAVSLRFWQSAFVPLSN